MTFRVLEGGRSGPPHDLPAKADARVAYDLSIRHFSLELAVNRASLEAIRDGVQALLDGESPGYAFVVTAAGSPCTVSLALRPVSLAPDAHRVPQDDPAPPDSEHLW